MLVLAVVAEPEESFLELERLESWEVFLVTNQDDARLLGSRRRKGMPQWWLWRQESDLYLSKKKKPLQVVMRKIFFGI